MISDYVANTSRNCEGMMNIVKNMNVFLDNYDKLIPFENQINESYELYSNDSMKAIKNDLITIALNNINWKEEQNKLKEYVLKNHSSNHEKNIINEIKLNKPKINKLSKESIMKMIELKDINTKEKGLNFINYRKHLKKQLKHFPKEITNFENKLIIQRNENVKNVMKITKQLLKEHRRYAYSSINNKSFTKLDGIIYKESQKEFIKNNLKKLITIL